MDSRETRPLRCAWRDIDHLLLPSTFSASLRTLGKHDTAGMKFLCLKTRSASTFPSRLCGKNLRVLFLLLFSVLRNHLNLLSSIHSPLRFEHSVSDTVGFSHLSRCLKENSFELNSDSNRCG